jgi:hypothetical protein
MTVTLRRRAGVSPTLRPIDSQRTRHFQAEALGLVAVGIGRGVWVVAAKLKQAVDFSPIDGRVDDVAAAVRVRV